MSRNWQSKKKHFLFNFASSIKTTVIEDWTTTSSMLLTFHLSLYIVLKNSSSCYVLVSLMTLWNIYSNNTALKQPNVTHLAFGYVMVLSSFLLIVHQNSVYSCINSNLVTISCRQGLKVLSVPMQKGKSY